MRYEEPNAATRTNISILAITVALRGITQFCYRQEFALLLQRFEERYRGHFLELFGQNYKIISKARLGQRLCLYIPHILHDLDRKQVDCYRTKFLQPHYTMHIADPCINPQA